MKNKMLRKISVLVLSLTMVMTSMNLSFAANIVAEDQTDSSGVVSEEVQEPVEKTAEQPAEELDVQETPAEEGDVVAIPEATEKETNTVIKSNYSCSSIKAGYIINAGVKISTIKRGVTLDDATVVEPSSSSLNYTTTGRVYVSELLSGSYKYGLKLYSLTNTDKVVSVTTKDLNSDTDYVTYLEKGQKYSVPDAIKRDGYTKSLYKTYNDGVYDDPFDASKAINTNTTLYVKWTPITYTIRFNANGGSGDPIANLPATYDADAYTQACTYTYEKHTFIGWNTNKNADEGIALKNLTTTPGKVVDVYAIWSDERAELVANDSPFLKKDEIGSTKTQKEAAVLKALFGDNYPGTLSDYTIKFLSDPILPLVAWVDLDKTYKYSVVAHAFGERNPEKISVIFNGNKDFKPFESTEYSLSIVTMDVDPVDVDAFTAADLQDSSKSNDAINRIKESVKDQIDWTSTEWGKNDISPDEITLTYDSRATFNPYKSLTNSVGALDYNQHEFGQEKHDGAIFTGNKETLKVSITHGGTTLVGVTTATITCPENAYTLDSIEMTVDGEAVNDDPLSEKYKGFYNVELNGSELNTPTLKNAEEGLTITTSVEQALKITKPNRVTASIKLQKKDPEGWLTVAESNGVSSLDVQARPDAEPEAGPVETEPYYLEKGVTYKIVADFTDAGLELNPLDLDYVELKNLNKLVLAGEDTATLKKQIEDEIKAGINDENVIPSDFLDGAEISVKYYSLDPDTITVVEGLDFTGTLKNLYWKDIDNKSNTIKIGELEFGGHDFGTQKNGGSIADGNTEIVKVVVTNDKYSGIELTARNTATVVDNRIPTTMSVNRVYMTYSEDEDALKNAILKAGLTVKDEDGNKVTFASDQITVSPEKLDVKLLQYQNVTVKYEGDDTYKGCEYTAKVMVFKASADIKVESKTVKYNRLVDSVDVDVTTTPEDLDYIKIYAGIDGDAEGFLSIEIPKSLQDKMKLDTGSELLNNFLEGIIQRVYKDDRYGLDLYKNIQLQIGDGVKLQGLGDILSNINEVIGTEIPDTIPVFGGKTIGEVFGVDTTIFAQITDIVSKLPSIGGNTVIKLGNGPKDAGVYLVTAVITENNYVNDIDTGILTIVQKGLDPEDDVELQWNQSLPKNKIIAKSDLTGEGAFKFGATLYDEVVAIDSKHIDPLYVGVTYDGKIYADTVPPTEAGAYDETITVIGGNYFVLPITRAFVIERMDVDLAMEGATVTYDGQQHGLTATATAADGTDLSDSLTYAYVGLDYLSSEAPINAGTYLVTATYAGDADYKPATIVRTLVINRADIDPVVSIDNWYYGDDANKPSITSGNPGGGDVTYYYKKVDESDKAYRKTVPTEAGEYVVLAKVDKTRNYNGGTATAPFTIMKRPVKITWGKDSFVYNGRQQAPKIAKVEGLLPLEALLGLVRVDTSVEGSHKNVGDYEIKATLNGLTSKNYVIDEGDEHPFTITKRPVTITINNIEKTYGDRDPRLTWEDRDHQIVRGDRLGIKLVREPGKNVGIYRIFNVSKDLNENYDITFVNERGKERPAIFKIVPKEIEVVVDDKTQIYGEHREKLTYSFDKSELVGRDKLGFKLWREPGRNVGTYDIKYRWSNKNYKVIANEETYEITKRPIVFNWTLDQKNIDKVTYDGKSHRAEATVGEMGFAYNDEELIDILYENELKTEIGKYTAKAYLKMKDVEETVEPVEEEAPVMLLAASNGGEIVSTDNERFDLVNNYEVSNDTFDYEIEPVKNVPTGDQNDVLPYALFGGLALAAIIAMLANKRRKEW